MRGNRAKVIVISNCKGGSGKTTVAIHLIVGLMEMGYRVASLDLDYRQQSLTRYIKNREATSKKIGKSLLVPAHHVLGESSNPNIAEAIKEDTNNIETALGGMIDRYDYIICDTGGSLTESAQLICSYADYIITPMGDSFMDFDLLGQADVENLNKSRVGVYAAMLWEQKKLRAQRDKKEIKWFVVRNRVATLDTINNRNIEKALLALSEKTGFKVLPGLTDRVIFKELFLHGLTLYDAINTPIVRVTSSTLAARQELFYFIDGLGIDKSRETT